MSWRTVSEDSSTSDLEFDDTILDYVKGPPFTACIEGFNTDNTEHLIDYFNDIKIKNISCSKNNVYIEFNTAEDFKNAFALTSTKKFGECKLQMKTISMQDSPFTEKEATHSEHSECFIGDFDQFSDDEEEIASIPDLSLNESNAELLAEAGNEASTSNVLYPRLQESEDNFVSALFDVQEIQDVFQITDLHESDDVQEQQSTSTESENEKIFSIRKEVHDLYQCLIQEVDENFSSSEMHQHHSASRESALEHFMIQTSVFDAHDLVEQNFEALSMEIEVSFEAMKNKQSKEQESRDSAIPHEMLQAIFNVVNTYEDRMVQNCLNATQSKDIDEEHAGSFPAALDMFELLTEHMTEDKSAADRKLFADLHEIYDRLVKQQEANFFEKCREKVVTWFTEALRGTTDFEKCCELKETAILKYCEKISKKFPDNPTDIESHKNFLQQSLDQEWVSFAECMAVSSRSEAVSEYRRAMSVACETATSERELGELNVQASQAAMDSYTLKTSGLPQSVVTEQQNALTQEISVESEDFKMENIEQRILKRHEMQNHQLSRAFTSGVEIYMNETQQPEDCDEGDVLRELEARHVTAQKIALNTFNLMTESVMTPELKTASRDNLVAELLKRYTKHQKFLTGKVLKQQVKIAQAAFSERMKQVVQVDDKFSQLQDQAQNETLVNFDLATADYDREVVVEYRAKLEEFFEYSLELVDTARTVAAEKGLCCVCTENRAAVVFQPCRHFNTCDTCAANLTTCAMCRAPIEDKIHVYL